MMSGRQQRWPRVAVQRQREIGPGSLDAPGAAGQPDRLRLRDRRAFLGGLGAAAGSMLLWDRTRSTGALASGTNPGLFAILDRLPDPLAEPDAPFLLGTYADVAAQLAANGVPSPTLGDTEAIRRWAIAIGGLAVPSLYGGEMAAGEIGDVTGYFGYDYFAVEETFFHMDGGSPVTLLRGRFDRAAVRATWERFGHLVGERDGIPIADLQQHDSVASDALYLRSMAHAAVLADDTLVFTAQSEALSAVLAAAGGRVPSFADRPEIVALDAAGLPTLASAQFVRGRERMKLLLFGITPGVVPALSDDKATTPRTAQRGEDTPRAVFALVMEDQSSAEAAATQIADNLETGEIRLLMQSEPLSVFFSEVEFRIAGDQLPVLIIEATVSPDSVRWNTRFWLSPRYPGDLLDGVQ